jgi:hypothetical protein
MQRSGLPKPGQRCQSRQHAKLDGGLLQGVEQVTDRFDAGRDDAQSSNVSGGISYR